MPEQEIALATEWGSLVGTLLLPGDAGPYATVLLVAGSGPTDRDGNNPLLPASCDSLKLLAQALARRGLASLRYDKRGVGASACAGLREDALRFDQLVDDAAACARMLQEDARVAEVVLLGHSEGALIAALAAQRVPVPALVSLAGAGERASSLMRRQIEEVLPPDLAGPAMHLLDALEQQVQVEDVPEDLVLLFRPSVQPYLASWFRHDPAQVLAQLQLPVLLLHGDEDAQVGLEQARLLAAAQPQAQLRVIEGMDHLLTLEGRVDAGAEAVAAEVHGWLHALWGGAQAVGMHPLRMGDSARS